MKHSIRTSSVILLVFFLSVTAVFARGQAEKKDKVPNKNSGGTQLDQKKQTEPGKDAGRPVNKITSKPAPSATEAGAGNTANKPDSTGTAEDVGEARPPKSQLENRDEDRWPLSLLKWLVIILGTALVVGGIVWLVLHMRRSKERERNEIRAGFSDLRNRHKTFDQKLETLSKITTDLSQQVAQQKAEISGLKRNMTDLGGSTYPPPPPVVSYPKEPPRFPVSATDYLGKIGQVGTPVKYDYKEGILVSDPANEGGLLIVQDEGRLYVVPSYGFFQTKSDYTNYFEKYYTCARPMGGNVWILQPATVNQVADGWQLDSVGELEIR
ncbi:MAG: hypothetical protein ACKVQW_15620 [Pyrinomonadaceae bacterium]